MAVDYYQILNIARQATGAEVRAAYLRLAQESHPDRNGEGTTGGENRFKQIQRAYEVLGDPAQRAAYDRSPQNFQHSGKNPVQYRRGPVSSGTSQRPPVAPSADGYVRRDIPDAWLLRRKRSKASWLRSAIWLVLMALCIWGCARALRLMIPATLAGDDVLPGAHSIENRRTADHVVQQGRPSESDVQAHNSAPDSIVVPSEAKSDETAGGSDSQDLASDGRQQDEIHDDGSSYQTSSELVIDGFSYPSQTDFDAALIDIESTYPPTAAAALGELDFSMDVPLPRQTPLETSGATKFDVRARRPSPRVPTVGTPMPMPSWTSPNWYSRDAYRHAGGEPHAGAAPSVTANRPFQHSGYGDPSFTTPRPGGRPLSSPILGSPYGVNPRTENYGGRARPYSNLRERFSPRSMGGPRWSSGNESHGSGASGLLPSSPYSPAYPSSSAYPSAESSMSSPYSPYSNDGGLYGP